MGATAGAAPLTTVRTTSVPFTVIEKCSFPLMASPFSTLNIPDIAELFRMSNVEPTVGTNPLIKVMFKVPLRAADPVTLS